VVARGTSSRTRDLETASPAEPEEEPTVVGRRANGSSATGLRRGTTLAIAAAVVAALVLIVVAGRLLAAPWPLPAGRSVFDTWPAGVAKVALLPACAVRTAAYLQYFAVVLAPAVFAMALHGWYQLELPDGERVEGRRIARSLGVALFISLCLVTAMAFVGDSTARLLLFAYMPVATTLWARHGDLVPEVRRLIRTWYLFLPLIFEYRALSWWSRYIGLPKEKEARAYGRLHAKYAPLLFRLLAKQGGVFVKVGQILSLLPTGVLPDAYTRELRRLQKDVPPRPAVQVRRLVSEALGRPLESVFSRFDDEPIGAASIGQVHRARLASDGREVVVKVQYPEVRRTIVPDFNSCERIVWFLDRSRIEEVREARIHYVGELDFEAEARTLQRVVQNLRGPFPTVRVPEPIPEFCTTTVLTMTFLEGTPLLEGFVAMAEAVAKACGKSVDELIAEAAKNASEIPATVEVDEEDLKVKKVSWRAKLSKSIPSLPDSTKLRLLQRWISVSRATKNVGARVYNHSAGRLGAAHMELHRAPPNFDPVKLSEQIWRVHGHQLIVDGLFSTDPHPGNILLVDGQSQALGLIDFGQVCELGLTMRLRFAHLIVALEEENDAAIAHWHAQLGMRTKAMSVELLALSARLKFGDVAELNWKNYQKYRKLEAKDPIYSQSGDNGLGRVERLICILRGMSFVLGLSNEHSPVKMWLDTARCLIAETRDAGSEFEAVSFARPCCPNLRTISISSMTSTCSDYAGPDDWDYFDAESDFETCTEEEC